MSKDFTSYISIDSKLTKANVEAGFAFTADLSGVKVYNSPNTRPLYYVTREGKTIGHIMYRSKKKTIAFKHVGSSSWRRMDNPVKALRALIKEYRESRGE